MLQRRDGWYHALIATEFSGSKGVRHLLHSPAWSAVNHVASCNKNSQLQVLCDVRCATEVVLTVCQLSNVIGDEVVHQT